MTFPPGAEKAGLNLKLKEGPYDEKSDMSPPCESGAPKKAPDCGKEMVMLAPAVNYWTSCLDLNGASLNLDMYKAKKILTNSPSVAWINAAFLKPPVSIGAKPAPSLDAKDIKAVNY
jgi:hypothetical protein